MLVSVADEGVYIVGEQPPPTIDLNVSGGNISVTLEPVEGRPTTLSALVGNSMSGSASNVLVRFYAGDPGRGGSQIGGDCVMSRVPGNRTTNVSVAWIPPVEGVVTIYVQADPTNAIREASEANSTASRVFAIGDSDTDGPSITGFAALEGGGDGDGVIGTDEDVWLLFTVTDPSGVGAVEAWVDGVSRTVSGPLTNCFVA